MEDCASAICKELNLDDDSISWFTSAAYCSNCYRLFCDIDYMQRSIQNLQQRLTETANTVQKLLLQNFNRGVAEEKSQAPPFTAYSHAIKYIGSQLQKQVEIKSSMYVILVIIV